MNTPRRTSALRGRAGDRRAPLLVVEGLKVEFDTPRRDRMRAVDGISYSVHRSEVLALVGESGCGKSVSALALIRLLPRPAGRIAGGRVIFEGVDLLNCPMRRCAPDAVATSG